MIRVNYTVKMGLAADEIVDFFQFETVGIAVISYSEPRCGLC